MIHPVQFSDLERAKRRAANIRHKTINKLDSYLIEFTRNFESRGGKVIWAPSEKDAHKELIALTKKQKIKFIVGIKSEISSELNLSDFLAKNKKEYTEYDPIAGFPELKSDPAMIILPAFMLIADSGMIVLTHESGSRLISSSSPGIRVVLAGIEDILPSIDDLDLFLSLQGPFSQDMDFPSSVKILSGINGSAEENQSPGTYVVLLDNHRTEVLRYREQRKALWCIHCRACDTVCPVGEQEKKMPVQAVTEPFLSGFRDHYPMSYRSSLCGACTVACPVKIPLHELLLYNRHEAVLNHHLSYGNKRSMNIWKYVMMRRWILDKSGPALRNYLVRSWLASATGGKDYLPRVAPKTFKEMWKEERFPDQEA